MTTDLIVIIPMGSIFVIAVYEFLKYDLRGFCPMSRNEIYKKILNKSQYR